MELTAEQKTAVAQWVAAGESLGQIQRSLESEFGLKMTYMEVRFLIEDLELQFAQEEEPKAAETASADEKAAGAVEDLEDAGIDAQAAAGKVSVSVDKITRPGAVVSGNVTFSGGQSMGWQLDQMGRLGLIPGPQEYQPSESDIAGFQAALQQVLAEQGF